MTSKSQFLGSECSSTCLSCCLLIFFIRASLIETQIHLNPSIYDKYFVDYTYLGVKVLLKYLNKGAKQLCEHCI